MLKAENSQMSDDRKQVDVAIISPSKYFKGGIYTVTKQLVELFKNHYKIKEISFRRQVPLSIYPAGERVKQEKKKDPIPEETAIIDWFNPFTWKKASKEIRNFAQLLYTPYWTLLVAPQLLFIIKRCKKRNMKVIVELHNIVEHHANSIVGFFSKTYLKKVVKKSDFIILHSLSDKKELERIIGYDYPHEIIPLMSHDFLLEDEIDIDTTKARQMLEIDERKKVIIQFGIVRPYKGVEYSIKATKILKNQGFDVFLLVVGEAWQNKRDLISIIEEEKLENDFKWIDKFVPDEDIMKYFKAADIAIYPYISASQSAAAQDAFAAKLPVVASDVGGFKDIIKHRENGMLCKPQDAKSLANAIKELITKEDLYEKIIKNAQKDIVENLSMENLSSNYVRIVENLMQNDSK